MKLKLKPVFLVAAISVLGTSFYANAQSPEPLVGTWALTGYKVETKDTHKTILAMGEHPTGRVIFSQNHHDSFIAAADGRKAGSSDAEKAKLLESFVAYSGTWTVKGDQWCTAVEIAWNPQWVGTNQCREFHIEGDTIHVLSPWRQMPNWPGMTRSIITFKKEA